mmetsp:Transcript_29520/g.67875  ORF Transcript_29520/g.67875 Transcript_29520/m.67875 type:complete len:134 (+) Transcript_29520:1086-1487(+)
MARQIINENEFTISSSEKSNATPPTEISSVFSAVSGLTTLATYVPLKTPLATIVFGNETISENVHRDYVSPNPFNLSRIHSINDVHKCASSICAICNARKHYGPFFSPANVKTRSTAFCQEIIEKSAQNESTA